MSGSIAWSPGQSYYLACPECGGELDRGRPEWHALAPERAGMRRWSYRLSQLLFPEIDLAQIVAAWQLAIRDPAQMNVFCTDRLALPRSSSQTLTPHDLAAARGDYRLGSLDRINVINEIGEADGNVELRTKNLELGGAEKEASCSDAVSSKFFALSSTFASFGGLDLGDQCWFVARAVEAGAPQRVRLLWIEAIAAERVRARVPELFRALNLRALCVDAGPLRDLSRDLAFALNGLDEEACATSDDAARNIYFSRDGAALPLRWMAAAERWEHARCMPVEFTQREFAQGAAQSAVQPVADFLAPTVEVPTSIGRYKIYTEKNRFAPPETSRAIGGRATVLSFDATDATYNCQPNALDYPIDFLEQIEEASLTNALMEGATIVAEVAALVHEQSVINTAVAATTGGAIAKTWSGTSGSDPIDDIDAQILNVIKAARYGSLMGVGVLFGAGAWRLFKNAPNVRGRFVAAGDYAIPNVTPAEATKLFVGNPEVRTSYMVVDTTKEGLTPSISFLLDTSVLVFARLENPTRRDPSFMKTFRLMGNYMVPGSYLRDDGRVEVAKFDWSEAVAVTNGTAAQLVTVS